MAGNYYNAVCFRCGLTVETDALTAEGAKGSLEEQQWLIDVEDDDLTIDVCPICQAQDLAWPATGGSPAERLVKAIAWLDKFDTAVRDTVKGDDA